MQSLSQKGIRPVKKKDKITKYVLVTINSGFNGIVRIENYNDILQHLNTFVYGNSCYQKN